MYFRRQPEGFRHIGGLGHLVEYALDAVVPVDLVDGGNIERSTVERDAVRLHELFGDDFRLAALAVLVGMRLLLGDGDCFSRGVARVEPTVHCAAGP